LPTNPIIFKRLASGSPLVLLAFRKDGLLREALDGVSELQTGKIRVSGMSQSLSSQRYLGHQATSLKIVECTPYSGLENLGLATKLWDWQATSAIQQYRHAGNVYEQIRLATGTGTNWIWRLGMRVIV
jgi:hypothetical protein